MFCLLRREVSSKGRGARGLTLFHGKRGQQGPPVQILYASEAYQHAVSPPFPSWSYGTPPTFCVGIFPEAGKSLGKEHRLLLREVDQAASESSLTTKCHLSNFPTTCPVDSPRFTENPLTTQTSMCPELSPCLFVTLSLSIGCGPQGRSGHLLSTLVVTMWGSDSD